MTVLDLFSVRNWDVWMLLLGPLSAMLSACLLSMLRLAKKKPLPTSADHVCRASPSHKVDDKWDQLNSLRGVDIHRVDFGIFNIQYKVFRWMRLMLVSAFLGLLVVVYFWGMVNESWGAAFRINLIAFWLGCFAALD